MNFFFSVAEPLPFPPGGGKSFLLGGSDDVLESVLGLGDLADLTVTNDETDYSYDVRTHTFLSCCLALHKFPNELEPCSLQTSVGVKQGVIVQEDVESQVHAAESL